MAPVDVTFIEVVAADRNLVVTTDDQHTSRLEPREPDALAWHCVLDDGFSTDSERDPASYVSWVCPTLRVTRTATDSHIPVIDVSRAGPQSDLGRLLTGLGRLAGRGRSAKNDAAAPERFVDNDPAGILDAGLRRRIENWPTAVHGDGVVRPAELTSIRRTGEGLVVQSSSWWGSAPALDHQIDLALDIARLLEARR